MPALQPLGFCCYVAQTSAIGRLHPRGWSLHGKCEAPSPMDSMDSTDGGVCPGPRALHASRSSPRHSLDSWPATSLPRRTRDRAFPLRARLEPARAPLSFGNWTICSPIRSRHAEHWSLCARAAIISSCDFSSSLPPPTRPTRTTPRRRQPSYSACSDCSLLQQHCPRSHRRFCRPRIRVFSCHSR